MNCESVRERLSGYIDGELDELTQLQVRSHLQQCPVCTAEEADLRRLVALLREVGEATAVPVPADFRSRLRSRLLQLPPPLARSNRISTAPRWRRWGLPAAAAAAVAAGVTLLVIPGVPPATVREGGPEPAVATTPAAQSSGPVAMDTASPSPGASRTGGHTGSGQSEKGSGSGAKSPSTGSAEASQPHSHTGGADRAPAQGSGSGHSGQPLTPADRPGGNPSGTMPTGAGTSGPERTLDGGGAPSGGTAVTASPTPTRPPAGAVAPATMQAVTYRIRLRGPVGPELEARLAQVLAKFPEARRLGDPAVAAEADGPASVSYTLAVPRGQEEGLLAALESLGEPVQRPQPEVIPLAAQYQAKVAELQAKQAWLAEKERELEQPGRSDLNRDSLQTDIARVRREIPTLEQEIALMQLRAQQVWIILTVEGSGQ